MHNDYEHTPFLFSEACIYAFYSIAEHIDTFEAVYIPKFIEVLTKIPYDELNEKLLGTAIDAIGNPKLDSVTMCHYISCVYVLASTTINNILLYL